MDDNVKSFRRHRIRYSLSHSCIAQNDIKRLNKCYKLKKTSSEINVKSEENIPRNLNKKLLKPFIKLKKKFKKPPAHLTNPTIVINAASATDIPRENKADLDLKVKKLALECEDARIIITNTVHKFLSQQADLNALEEKASKLEQNALELQLDAKVVRKRFSQRYKKTIIFTSVIVMICLIIFFTSLGIVYNQKKN